MQPWAGSYVKNAAKYLSEIWEPDQTIENYGHRCLISSFGLFNPQEFFALLVCRLCWYWMYIEMVINGLRKALPVDVAASFIYALHPRASGHAPAYLPSSLLYFGLRWVYKTLQQILKVARLNDSTKK